MYRMMLPYIKIQSTNDIHYLWYIYVSDVGFHKTLLSIIELSDNKVYNFPSMFNTGISNTQKIQSHSRELIQIQNTFGFSCISIDFRGRNRLITLYIQRGQIYNKFCILRQHFYYLNE